MENQLKIVPKQRLANFLRENSHLNVSDAATERMLFALQMLSLAIVEVATASAVNNRRKTLMEQDIDVAFESLYSYLNVFDKIFEQDDDFDINKYV